MTSPPSPATTLRRSSLRGGPLSLWGRELRSIFVALGEDTDRTDIVDILVHSKGGRRRDRAARSLPDRRWRPQGRRQQARLRAAPRAAKQATQTPELVVACLGGEPLKNRLLVKSIKV